MRPNAKKTNWQNIAEKILNRTASCEECLAWLEQYDGPMRYEIFALLGVISETKKIKEPE